MKAKRVIPKNILMSIVIIPRIFAPFESLRCGMTTRRAFPAGMDRLDLAARLPELAGMPGAGVVVGEQVHGCSVAVIQMFSEGPPDSIQRDALSCPEKLLLVPNADAFVTRQAGVLLSVRTADCVPIALADPVSRSIGVVHAGREGTRLGIVRRAVAALASLGARPENLLAWIGPSISAPHYEVSPRIAAEFQALFGKYPGVIAGPEGRRLNLAEINRLELIGLGVAPAHIELDPRCTFESPDDFYSYRREGTAAGRMATFIGIENSDAGR